MGNLAQHLLRITAAALIAGAVKRLLPEKGTAAQMGKLLTGLFLAFTVISPLAQAPLLDWQAQWTDLQQQAQEAATAGEQQAKSALRESIKQRTEAYILDKAKTLAAQVAVEVTLSNEAIPVPIAVRISGNISPYARMQLQTILQEELGIPKEAQAWT